MSTPSTTKIRRMWPSRAPRAFMMPISWVRSSTLMIIVLVIPIAATTRATTATNAVATETRSTFIRTDVDELGERAWWNPICSICLDDVLDGLLPIDVTTTESKPSSAHLGDAQDERRRRGDAGAGPRRSAGCRTSPNPASRSFSSRSRSTPTIVNSSEYVFGGFFVDVSEMCSNSSRSASRSSAGIGRNRTRAASRFRADSSARASSVPDLAVRRGRGTTSGRRSRASRVWISIRNVRPSADSASASLDQAPSVEQVFVDDRHPPVVGREHPPRDQPVAEEVGSPAATDEAERLLGLAVQDRLARRCRIVRHDGGDVLDRLESCGARRRSA